MLALFCLSLATWVDSYAWCRQYLWGDRYRGNYHFVTSSYGAIYFESRSNCDVDHHFTRNHQSSYHYGPWKPTIAREWLGFGSYKGTRYCWYGNLYPVTTYPAYNDPRWQKEPYGMVRLPYWPLIVVSGCLCAPRLLTLVRTRRANRRERRGLCRTCGYSLTGNTSGVCPECGMPAAQSSG